jgi:hypothetical protein
MEKWKYIRGYEAHYEVSNTGMVRSLKAGGSLILKPNLCPNYPLVTLYRNGVPKTYLVHRLVAMMFIPNPNRKPCVNHINGMKSDNRVGNLEWCTHSENQMHAIKTGLIVPPEGQDHHASGLTNAQAKEIRLIYVPYVRTMPMLAKEYGVSKSCIQSVIEGKTYKEA